VTEGPRLLRRWFDDTPWMRAWVKKQQPLEVLLLVAADNEVIRNARREGRGASLQFTGVMVDDHPIYWIKAEFPDKPLPTIFLETFVNPLSPQGQQLVDLLTTQRDLEVHFYNQSTGQLLGGRRYPLSAEVRQGARNVQAHCAGLTTDPDSWEQAIREMMRAIEDGEL